MKGDELDPELNEWCENRTFENLVLFFREELEKIICERRLRRKTVEVLKKKKLVSYNVKSKKC